MPFTTSRHQQANRTRCMRGGIYILTLATSLLITTIGIAAITHGRLSVQRVQAQGESAITRRLAFTGLEAGLNQLNGGQLTLSTQAHDTWKPLLTSGSRNINLKWQDTIDSKLINDTTDPLQFLAQGQATKATQAVATELVPVPGEQLTSKMIANGSFESSLMDWDAWPENPDANLSLSTVSGAAEGSSFVEIDTRTGPWAGMASDLNTTDWPEQATVEITFWARQAAGNLDTLAVTLCVDLDSSVDKTQLVRCRPMTLEDQWVQHTFRVRVPWAGTVQNASLLIYTTTQAAPFQIDAVDVSIVETNITNWRPRPLTLRRVLIDTP